MFLINLEGKVGKVGRVGRVGKVGKEGRLREKQLTILYQILQQSNILACGRGVGGVPIPTTGEKV